MRKATRIVAKTPRGMVVALALAFVLSGCAGTRMRIPQMNPVTKVAMQERFEKGIRPSLDVPVAEREGLAREVAGRIHAGAINMCQALFGPEHNCHARLARYRLSVKSRDSQVNAQIDSMNRITVFGGLIRKVGSPDELAAVLAHEYAHGLMAHVGRKMRNVGGGALIGMAVGAAVGAAVSDDPDAVSDAMRVGLDSGATIGARVYSQAMENEADHLGLFILNDAGYSLKAASHFHMRLLNERRFVRKNDEDATLLYLRSHPGSRERIQKLIAAEAMIKKGHTRPQWKK